ncbi:MAG: hypothetical protein EA371_00275 [Gammaproteobacteria bacterium]|nr:MAG: hypothetical protein EA371_00275 [Gammaproteobacteria bacterium]
MPLVAWSAGGHYPVDDAGITAPGDIQIESWITRVNSDNVEFGFLPAATVRDRLELTAGVYRIETGAGDFMRFEPAAKLALPVSGMPGVSLAASLALGVAFTF